MSATPRQNALHTDHVWEVLEQRQAEELRFRSAVISSTALHTVVMLMLLLAPMFVPTPLILASTPVNLVALAPPEPTPPAPVEEEAAATEREPPPEPEPQEPQDVPEDLEAQRQREAEEEARKRAEEEESRREAEERREAAEAARRRREAEERRQREEEEARRRAPQEATRREAEPQPEQQVTQRAERGSVFGFGEETQLTEEDFGFNYWLERVLANIANKWQPPPRPMGSQEILAVINFRVDRNGRIITGPDIRNGSGQNAYDLAALRAIGAGQPFPPLPQAYRGRSLGINLGFRQ